MQSLGNEKGMGMKVGDEIRNPNGGKGEECELGYELEMTCRRKGMTASLVMRGNRWEWRARIREEGSGRTED